MVILQLLSLSVTKVVIENIHVVKIVYLQSLNSHLENGNLRQWSSCNCSVCLSSRLSLFKISLSFKIYISHSLNGHLKSNLIPKQNSPHMLISCSNSTYISKKGLGWESDQQISILDPCPTVLQNESNKFVTSKIC